LRLLRQKLPERVTVSVSCIAMRSNLAGLRDFPKLLDELGVRMLYLQSLEASTESLRHELLTGEESVGQAIQEIQDACVRHGIQLHFTVAERLRAEAGDSPAAVERFHGDGSFSTLRTRQCLVPWQSPFVTKDGQVLPCCYGGTDTIMGDLRKESFETIWNGEAFQAFRSKLIHGADAPEICKRCTQAPIGIHPRRFAARLDLENSRLDARNCLIIARNTGVEAWTRERPVRVGTFAPRDRPSRFFQPTWLSQNRVTECREDVVLPGQSGTFAFRLSRSIDDSAEWFQLVVDGVTWLEDTDFEIKPRLRRRMVIKNLLRRELMRGVSMIPAGQRHLRSVRPHLSQLWVLFRRP
jgi:radical SAM protein with 4Fe4S-binding SPASM domain